MFTVEDIEDNQVLSNTPKKKSIRNSIQALTNRFNIYALAYLALTLPAGILLILFDKHESWLDREAHWGRLLQISQGTLLPVPNPDGKGSFGGFNHEGVFENFNNTAINSPFVYLPGILGHGHVRLASLSTLLVCACLIAFAISLSKGFAPAFLGISMLPMNFLSICYPTADAMTNAFSLLFIGFTLYVLQSTDPITNRQSLTLIVLSIFLGLIKITCAPLILLVWLLPHHAKNINAKKPILVCCLATFATLLSTATWMHITAHIPGSAAVTLDEYAEGKRLIFAHPLQMVKSLFITLVQPLDINWDGYNLGRNIQLFTGNGPVLPASVTVPILFASTILILKGCATNLHIDWSGRLIAIAILILFFAATGAGIMASWGSRSLGRYIDGIQSRYYFPIYPILIMLIPRVKMEFSNRKYGAYFISGLLIWGYASLLLAHCLSFA